MWPGFEFCSESGAKIKKFTSDPQITAYTQKANPRTHLASGSWQWVQCNITKQKMKKIWWYWCSVKSSLDQILKNIRRYGNYSRLSTLFWIKRWCDHHHALWCEPSYSFPPPPPSHLVEASFWCPLGNCFQPESLFTLFDHLKNQPNTSNREGIKQNFRILIESQKKIPAPSAPVFITFIQPFLGKKGDLVNHSEEVKLNSRIASLPHGRKVNLQQLFGARL